MIVKFKNLGKATLPQYAKPGDAGMDLTATSISYDEYGNVVYGTGLSVEIPTGYVCLLFPRSSNSKKDLLLSNSVGVLDSGYRGEIFFKYRPVDRIDISNQGVNIDEHLSIYKETLSTTPLALYQVGERIGQMIVIPYPQIEPIWADELSESVRGAGGFGSTGK